ncbi:MAG: DUF1611 domain-containing protein [Thermodesulfobacteriota bacterium]|nr:DUF1611 domain-containing protein [Thermodesulfobacteriota bacterium]
MTLFSEGNAIVYCEGAFGTPNGKTAHGLVRRTRRYEILSVVDSCCAGKDAGMVLDAQAKGIPIHPDVPGAVEAARRDGADPTHLVIGLAPDGGRLSAQAREDVIQAITLGLNVDSGLHDFLLEDVDLAALAAQHGVIIRDIRKCPPRKGLHFFEGKIEQVNALKVAVLGTDSAVGKRTTAWILVDALQAAGWNTEFIGTGQTAWIQGARYGIILDALINDFVSGEIEHIIWTAWHESQPDVIIIEGQGSLMNPAYPGGFEILAAGRPDAVVLQHAPARREYDGFPGYSIHPLEKQIEAIELLSGKPVVAICVNHEGLEAGQVPRVCHQIRKATGLPACDMLLEGPEAIVRTVLSCLKGR